MTATTKYAALIARIEADRAKFDAERMRCDSLEEKLRDTGVCMSCIFGAYDPCTDCLGTGWDNGNNPHEEARALRAQLAEAKAALTRLILDYESETGSPAVAARAARDAMGE